MTNEIEQYTPAAELAPASVEPTTAISVLMQHADAMDVAYQLADKMCRTSIVPSIYRQKPDDATAAILYGAEIGLNPIQSLQNVFPVHGMPSIYTRTMVAIVKSKGHKVWTVESSDESVTVAAQRRGEAYVEESTWTFERALKAGYVPTIDEKTGKYALNANGKLIGNEKYLKDPQAMLYAKAAAEVCRKIAPDILLGIAYTSEELELEPQPIKAKAERVEGPKRRGTAGLAEHLGVATEPKTDESKAAKTKPEPKAKLATAAQLKKLGGLLENEKYETPEAKLDYLKAQFGDQLTDPRQLTFDQVDALSTFLEQEQAADAAKAAEAAAAAPAAEQ
ncbi:hypothetical protein AXA44_02755 [Rhodococcus sp. SC4]|nr:hypothetical protein AXA44_02755 [Rhodococcus sp. SC4]